MGERAAETEADIHKNRLYITIYRLPTPDEVSEIAEEMIAAIRTLKPGFDIVDDLTRIGGSLADDAVQAQTLEALKQFKALGARRVVIVAKSVILKMQIARMTKQFIGETLSAASVDEAEALLDGSAT